MLITDLLAALSCGLLPPLYDPVLEVVGAHAMQSETAYLLQSVQSNKVRPLRITCEGNKGRLKGQSKRAKKMLDLSNRILDNDHE